MCEQQLTYYSNISQIIIALVAVIGLFISLYFSRKSINENKIDRQLRQAPFLAFKEQPEAISIIFPTSDEEKFSPEKMKKIMEGKHIELSGVEQKYGMIHNYGTGSAFGTSVIWVPKQIVIDKKTYKITDTDEWETYYRKISNVTKPDPRSLLPGDYTQLSELPIFVSDNKDKNIGSFLGQVYIIYFDIAGKKYVTIQEFDLSFRYAEKSSITLIISTEHADEKAIEDFTAEYVKNRVNKLVKDIHIFSLFKKKE
jgi:hypothetical protein